MKPRAVRQLCFILRCMSVTICPTITAANVHQYRQQIERVEPFVKRLHIDFMDGQFASPKSPNIIQAWWPEGVTVDFHVMYEKPIEHRESIISLNPNLVIFHAEADMGHFAQQNEELRSLGIKTGLALLQKTRLAEVKDWLDKIDHLLIFSGSLGKHGGTADLSLLAKGKEAKNLNPNLEIGWDGGINDRNAKELIDAGVDVLNVGGYIHHSDNPAHAYATLEALA